MNQSIRRLSRLTVAALGLLAPAASPAVPSADCCLRNTSSATAAINRKGVEQDERFFTAEGAPPNLMFVLDASGSMLDLPGAAQPSKVSKADRGTGCESAVYQGLIDAGSFSMTKSYPPPDLGVAPADWNGDTGFPDLFHEAGFYRYRGWDSRAGATDQGTAAKACENSSNVNQCVKCVTEVGYYLDPEYDPSHANYRDSRNIYSGKFLNFHPPKYVAARTVLKNVLWTLRSARFGLTTFSGSTGGTLVQGMTPVCDKSLAADVAGDTDAAGWENQRKSIINSINGHVEFDGATPVAEALLNVGQYFSDADRFEYWFGSRDWTNSRFSAGNIQTGNRPICWGCQVSAVVLISDGAPYNDNCVPKCIQELNASCPGCNQKDGACNGDCPNKCGSGGCKSAGSQDCCSSAEGSDWQQAPNFLDDVAQWFATHDLALAGGRDWSADGRQTLITYTVGFGYEHPLLTNAAAVGGGRYYTANDRTELQEKLIEAIEDIKRRATSFGVASVTTLQTDTGRTSGLLPRFIPGSSGEEWKGMLYHFAMASEFVNGCKPTAADASPHPGDLDADHQCGSLFYVDRDNDVVEQDAVTGLFLKRNTNTPAKPLWEAGRELSHSNPTYDAVETAPLADPRQRSLWTVVDSNNDQRLDATDTMVEFKSANAATLMPYLQIGADIRADPACTAIATRMGIAGDDATRASWGQKCAEVIIDYYRGLRSDDPDPTRRSAARPWLLGDIFHGSPVPVEPPWALSACDIGRNQCVASLGFSGKDTSDAPQRAYEDYRKQPNGPCGATPCAKRQRLVLVGANDGFLHAFDYGVPSSPERLETLTDRYEYEWGSGREVWAFIPPDLLGSLKHTLRQHAYYVDSTAMVRDIWVDGAALDAGNGVKEAGEFRTIAVVGERSGGTHFFALDVTEDMASATVKKPKFLWLWPQPCDALSAQVGQSWSLFFPKPPPIGPVLLDAATTGYGDNGFDFKYRIFDSEAEDWVDRTVKAQERWVVMLSGGYDRYLARGRGLATIDAWTGRTLWQAFFDPALGTDPKSQMAFPIAAGVAMLDIGSGEEMTGASASAATWSDKYFDTANVGDLGGNLWVARMHEPGRLDEATGRVSNWPIARAFQAEKPTASSDSMARRQPFTYITANSYQNRTGYLRTFVGSGDRNAILDPAGGVCSVDNPLACVQMGCTVDTRWSTLTAGDTVRAHRSAFSGGRLISTSTTQEQIGCRSQSHYDAGRDWCLASCTTAACNAISVWDNRRPSGRAACIDLVEDVAQQEAERAGTCDTCAESQTEVRVEISGCPSTVASAIPLSRYLEHSCKKSGSSLACKTRVLKSDTAKLELTATAKAAAQTFRFYGMHTYGGKNDRTFGDAESAEAFDANRLTECSGTCTSSTNKLKSVGTLNNLVTPAPGEMDEGWYLSYDVGDEKTGAPATVAGDYVYWDTLDPSLTTGVCSSVGAQSSKLVTAHVVTGMPQSLGGNTYTARYSESSVLVPPQERMPVLMVAGGKLVYGLMETQPDDPRVKVVGMETDLVQSVYNLECTEQDHLCRHTVGGQTCAP